VLMKDLSHFLLWPARRRAFWARNVRAAICWNLASTEAVGAHFLNVWNHQQRRGDLIARMTEAAAQMLLVAADLFSSIAVVVDQFLVMAIPALRRDVAACDRIEHLCAPAFQ
jgi:hypothetical protein